MAGGSQDPKDLVIKRLRLQIEKYKQKLEEMGVDNLTQKIEELEKELEEKDALIKDLQEASGGGEASQNVQDLKKKLILAQTKIRKLEKEIAELREENESLKKQLQRLEKLGASPEQIDKLKKKLIEEEKTSDLLREQINKLLKERGNVEEYQSYITQLESELQDARSKIEALSQNRAIDSSGEVSQEVIQAYEQKIQELQDENLRLKSELEELANQGGGGPIATLRYKREIDALKSQIKMLKRDNEQLQRKYDELVRKNEFSFDDGW